MTSHKAPSSLRAVPGAHTAWRSPLLVLGLVLTTILLLYWDTAVAMVTIWYRSGTFTHAFVVPPIVLWLVWRKWPEVARLSPRPALVMLLPMAAAALFWLLGDLTAVNSVTQLAFVALLVLAVPAVLGLQVGYTLLFPLCFMFFSVPMGEFLLPTFMEWTADFTVMALRFTGVPVLREGLQFVIPSGNWSVVEACSGIRYLIASVTVGALFAHLNYQSTTRRIAFVLVSIIVPVLANWLRAYMIVMLGHLSGNTLAVGVDHLLYGWVFFGVVIMLMFVVGARWAEPEPPLPAVGAHAVTTGAVVHGGVLAAAALVLAVAAWPLIARSWIDTRAPSGTVRLVLPPALSQGWVQDTAPQYAFNPNFENPTAAVNARYGKAHHSVGLYLGFYRNQDYNRKLVSSNNVLVTSNDRSWSAVRGGARDVALGPHTVPLRSTELRRLPTAVAGTVDGLVVWQVYWINGTLTANEYLAKVYSALYQLLGRGDDSAVIVVYAEKPPSGIADASLTVFMAENYAMIDVVLRQAMASR